jgi:hypothetical protein
MFDRLAPVRRCAGAPVRRCIMVNTGPTRESALRQADALLAEIAAMRVVLEGHCRQTHRLTDTLGANMSRTELVVAHRSTTLASLDKTLHSQRPPLTGICRDPIFP